MKKCKKCKQTKELSEFQKRSDSFDGYRNECKECRSKFYKGYISPNQTRNSIKWQHNNKEKFRTHWMLHHKQIRNGEFLPEPCEICGNLITEAHHKDYSKPFKITWLCRKHHKEVHCNA